jgi:hypothetical protein
MNNIQGPIRISMPAAVAFDLAAFQKGIANLVARLGCAPCFSGADCRFIHERDFVIKEKNQKRGQSLLLTLWAAGGNDWQSCRDRCGFNTLERVIT